MYIKLYKVCLITFAYRENAHMSHLFIMFFSGLRKCLCISIFIPACGRYIWEISQSTLILVKMLVTHWQFVGYNRNFDFCPSCQSNLFLVTWFMLAICKILPLAPCLCSNLWLVVLPNGKFLLFFSLFGMLAIKAMAFWEILAFSPQNLPFLKKCQRGYVNTIK